MKKNKLGVKKGEAIILPFPEFLSPPQEKFFLSEKRYIAYGGARGGGKSFSIDWKAVIGAVTYEGISMIIIRKTYADVYENHTMPLMKMTHGMAKYNDTEKAFNFANGSRIKMGYCSCDADLTQYQGREYDWVFIDEATQLSEHQFDSIKACNRSLSPFPKRLYLSCNPGGKLLIS